MKEKTTDSPYPGRDVTERRSNFDNIWAGEGWWGGGKWCSRSGRQRPRDGKILEIKKKMCSIHFRSLRQTKENSINNCDFLKVHNLFCKQNQLGAQIFFICLLLFTTCFRRICAHHQEKILYLCDTWYWSLYIDDCLVCRAEFIPPCIPDIYL